VWKISPEWGKRKGGSELPPRTTPSLPSEGFSSGSMGTDNKGGDDTPARVEGGGAFSGEGGGGRGDFVG